MLRAAGCPVEWLSADEIARRFPSIRYPREWSAVSDPSGSILLASACVAAVQRAFVASGGAIVTARATHVAAAGAASRGPD